MKEVVYKEIKGISCKYKAGNDGKIYSFCRKIPIKLKGGVRSDGNYLGVSVIDSDGKRIQRDVHRLVCTAFHGEAPTKYHQVAHKDGNSFNNIPENLRWSTIKDNLNDKFKHGTHDSGFNNTRSKADKEQLFVIRWLLDNTILNHDYIGSLLGVNRVFVSKIANKSRYSNLDVWVEYKVNKGEINENE